MTEQTRDVNKILERVRGLIAKAENTDNPHEQDTYRRKADELMLKYAIEEAELEATRPAADRMVPERLLIEVCEKGSHLETQLTYLAQVLASHFRCRVVFYGLGKKAVWATKLQAVVVGFPTDLKFFELLFTSLHLHMSGHLEPKPDVSKSFDENIYILHEAGVKWERIAHLMNATFTAMPGNNSYRAAWRSAVRPGKGMSADILVPWPDGHRLINAYKRHCKKIGDIPRAIQSPVTYQRNFAEDYVNRISVRLWEMRRASDSGPGTALALRTEDVDKAFEEMFPDPETAKAGPRLRYDAEARAAGRRAANQADLGGQRVQDGSRKALD